MAWEHAALHLEVVIRGLTPDFLRLAVFFIYRFLGVATGYRCRSLPWYVFTVDLDGESTVQNIK